MSQTEKDIVLICQVTLIRDGEIDTHKQDELQQLPVSNVGYL